MGLFETTNHLFIALGKTLVHSIWIGLLILAILRVLLAVIPGRLSNLRYLVSVASMLLLAGSVLTAFALLFDQGNHGESHVRMIESLKMLPLRATDSSSEFSWSPQVFFQFCSYLYFAGLVYMMFRAALSFKYLRGLRKSGRTVRGEWKARLESMAGMLGIQREVKFLESDQIMGPLLTGILKPAVIVPAGMFTHLSVSQVESILMHELYHLKRLDALINVMQLFMEGVLFYHPAVWLISDIIRREREHSCDDAVLLTGHDPVDYAKALVNLADQQQYIRLAPGAGGSNKHHLTARIYRIINRSPMKKNTQERMRSLLQFAGALLLILLISGFSSGFSLTKRIELMPGESLEVASQVPTATSVAIQDTIREPEEPETPQQLEEPETPQQLEEIDWDQIKEEMEAARLEAMEEIDWDQIKEEMEAARLEAMEEIDWDQIKEEMEAARLESMEEIDWDEIKEEMDSVMQDFNLDFDLDLDLEFDQDFDFDIDMDAIQDNLEQARREMKEIDWEEIKKEMEHGLTNVKIDVEELKREIEKSMKDIDWEEIRKEIEKNRTVTDFPHTGKDI